MVIMIIIIQVTCTHNNNRVRLIIIDTVLIQVGVRKERSCCYCCQGSHCSISTTSRALCQSHGHVTWGF